jgi:putative membrane-bound dehydrogenase-like protein
LGCTSTPAPLPEFAVAEDLRLTRVAAEPLVFDPVDIQFDEWGRTYVLEMPGYPFGEEQSRIVELRDQDEDGVYDERILFADSLRLASAILPYRAGLLVAAPPYLLHVRDTDADDRADAIDTLLGGFATGNLQHNFNGLSYGLDGWILAANGGNSGTPYWWGDSMTIIDLRGQDLRFHPDTRRLERLGESSGGFGLGLDPWGHVFATHNLEHLSTLVFPDRYLRRAPAPVEHTLENISDHEENGLARIYPIGEQETRVNHPEQSGYFSGACGVTYYGGGTLGARYENTVWVADVVLNLVHVDRVAPRGASFVASRVFPDREVLASRDRAFRPVNMRVGPDGALYLVDMHRAVIEHPEWIPDEIESQLDLDAGKDQGRIYRLQGVGGPARFDFSVFRTVEGCLEQLSHPNQWVRTTAHRLLADADLDAAQLGRLTQLLASPRPTVRLHAGWLLHRRGALHTAQYLSALADPEPGVRENALRMAEAALAGDPELLAQGLALLGDSDPRVRLQAALSTSTLSAADFARHDTAILAALRAAAGQPMDRWHIAAITLAARHAPTELFTALLPAARDSGRVELLAALAYASSQTTVGLEAILAELAAAGWPPADQRRILSALKPPVAVVPNGRVALPAIQALEAAGDLGVVYELAALRDRLDLQPSPTFLRLSRAALARVPDTTLSASLRQQQLDLLALLPYREKADVLFACLTNTEPLALQEAALRQLASYREPEIGRRLVALWPELGPQARRGASDLLLYNEVHHDALLTGLEEGVINIGEMNFDLERRRTLLWWTDNADTQRRAEALFSDAGVATRAEVIARMRPALDLAGAPAHGREVFTIHCAQCHVYGAEGRDVGPVLTEISRKSKEALLHDILDPNAAVDTRYINHRLETKDGQVHVGIVALEDDREIVIKKMGGSTVTVPKTEIKRLSSLGQSLMMEGLEAQLSPQDLADLLAFLQNETVSS